MTIHSGSTILSVSIFRRSLLIPSVPLLFFADRFFMVLLTSVIVHGSKNKLLVLPCNLDRYSFTFLVEFGILSANFFPTVEKYFANEFETTLPSYSHTPSIVR